MLSGRVHMCAREESLLCKFMWVKLKWLRAKPMPNHKTKISKLFGWRQKSKLACVIPGHLSACQRKQCCIRQQFAPTKVGVRDSGREGSIKLHITLNSNISRYVTLNIAARNNRIFWRTRWTLHSTKSKWVLRWVVWRHSEQRVLCPRLEWLWWNRYKFQLI